MSRPADNHPINTISGRRGLPIRPNPWWRGAYPGLRIGWLRRLQDPTGRWIARLALPGNDIREKVLGAADDAPLRADGRDLLSFAQAAAAAQVWAEKVKADPHAEATAQNRRPNSSAPTVGDALPDYAAAKRRLKQADRAGEAITVLERHLPGRLRDLPTPELTPEFLHGWLAALQPKVRGGERAGAMSQGRVDKLRNVMRAALRQARVPDTIVRDGLSAAAMPRRQAPASREVIPSQDDVKALLAAASTEDQDLGLFMETLSITGTRPDQLSRTRRPDLDVSAGMLTIPSSRKGRAGIQKAVKSVSFPIGRELAERIAAQADPDTGLLFHTARMVQDISRVAGRDGAIAETWVEAGRIAWNKNIWTRKVRRAVQAADLDPAITLYTLRHYRIIKFIQGGVSLREIAAMTSAPSRSLST